MAAIWNFCCPASGTRFAHGMFMLLIECMTARIRARIRARRLLYNYFVTESMPHGPHVISICMPSQILSARLPCDKRHEFSALIRYLHGTFS